MNRVLLILAALALTGPVEGMSPACAGASTPEANPPPVADGLRDRRSLPAGQALRSADTRKTDSKPGRARASRGDPTFNRDIARILFGNCVMCHHDGGSGPFSLLTYESVRKRAALIAKVTASRYMPPWLPEPGYGDFEGARRLTDDEIATIRAWVDRDMPEGEAADLPPAPQFHEGWQVGTPDLILSMPDSYTLQASGPDVFRNFVFSVPVTTARYVRAVEIAPGNERVVHHANIVIDHSGTARRLDGYDPEPGFEGMRVKLESRRFDPQSHFLFWKPGTVLIPDTDEMSWIVTPGTDLVLNMHMKPSGKQESVRPAIGLYFCEQPPTKFPMLLQLEHDGALDIPPGAGGFVVTDELVLPLDVELLGIYPHAHYLGKEIRALATLPSGDTKSLIWIKKWNLDWQAVYRYAKPIPLPKGTTISMRWTYDNTSANERNPNHPPKRVGAGNQSSDEMSHLWIQVLPRRKEGRLTLEEELLRRKLAKYPRDFDAHLGLGSILQSMGRLEEALVLYRKAVLIKPGDASAENNLGAALLAASMTPEVLGEAIRHFREALERRPDYTDAHFNIAKALLAQGLADEAVEHLRAVVHQTPQDAEPHSYLGAALIGQNQLEEAESELQAALRLDRTLASVRYNLGYVHARRGQLDEAVLDLEEALRVDPKDAAAHTLLGSILASQGKLPPAIEHLESALRLDPENPTARENLKRAKDLVRGSPGKASDTP